MIKINLLPEAKAPGITRVEAMPGAGIENLNNIIIIVFVVIGLGLSAWRWWGLNRTIHQLDSSIEAATKEYEKLKPIIEEVKQFKARKAELEKKLNLINQLKANQQGPVHIMDELSNCIPDLLWLDRMNLKGNTITLQGKAFNPNAVSEFIEKLYASPYFGEPNLQEIREQKEFYTFRMTFPFTFSPKKEEEAHHGAGS